LTKVVGFLACFGLPVFLTAIAPVSVTHLNRENGRVTATTRSHLLFVIPYIHKTLDDIRDADDRVHAGEWIQRRAGDSGIQQRAEDEGFLVLSNAQQNFIEAPVSPLNLDAEVAKVRAFLKDPTQQHLRLIAVANWKFSVIIGIPMTLLAALYVVGVTLAFFRWIARLQRPRSDITTPRLP
jgi:hypothetical protein